MLKPLNGFIVVKQDEIQTKTKSGLVLPDTAQHEVCTGTVEAIYEVAFTGGHNHMQPPIQSEKPCPVKVGDKVVYRRYAGFEYEGKLIVNVGELVATNN